VSYRFGDVVFVKGHVTGWRAWRKWLVSFLIRAMSTSSGEAPTFANHVAMVLKESGDGDWILVEALGKRGFVETRLGERYADAARFEVRVARHSGLTNQHATKMLLRIQNLKGKQYGWLKIAGHASDYALTQLWNACGGRGDVYALRWLCRNGNYPICSWAVADIYLKGGLPFRKQVALAQPDCLYDECAEGPPWSWVNPEVA